MPYVTLTRKDLRCRAVTTIHQMRVGEQLARVQLLVNRAHDRVIGGGGGRCFYLRNQVRQIGGAGLGKMNFIPYPGSAALFTVACLRVVRRPNEVATGWDLLG